MSKEFLPNTAKIVEASIGEKRLRARKGELIFKEGDPIALDFPLYVVAKGIIGLQKENNGGGFIVSVLREGDVFGFEDFGSSERTRSATSIALMPSLVTRYDIPEERMIDVLPDLLTARIREQERFQELLKLGTNPEKIAYALLEFAQDDRVGVSQRVIGQRVGASRQAVNRILRMLSNRGLITPSTHVAGKDRNHHEIVIVDSEQLGKIK